MGPAVEAKGLYHIYREREVETVALRGAELTLHPASWTSIMGPSGSGKSTLLHVLAGLLERGRHRVGQLSGGEAQRAAIAVALAARPRVLLTDEPTGNLDSANAQSIARLLVEAAAEQGAAVVLVTHDPAVARHADRVVGLRSGRLEATDPGDPRPGDAR